MKNLCFLILVGVWFNGFAQVPCTNGFAGLYPCKNIDFMSLLTPDDLGAEEKNGVRINDIWGWTDTLTNKEYVILGMVNGTSFIDISDPLNPLVLGTLIEHNSITPLNRRPVKKPQHLGAKSIWRDIKVYNNHAYIVSEDPLHGMQVFDLTLLRDTVGIPKDFNETGHYDGFGNAHNLVINEETGYAYGVGATGLRQRQTCTDGGLHMISLKDPANPVFAGCFDEDGYTHDAQVVIYTGPDEEHQSKEIAFNSNEDTFTIVDVSDKENPLQISRTGYDRVEYMHQGWLTEDQRFFLSNDERDEERYGFNTRTAIWDVTDLDNPRNTGFYFSDKESIDHNLYIKNRYVYQSNYTAGLRVLNSSAVEDSTLSEAGYFDTYPLNDFIGFSGTWSNYPYFKSGLVVVSDDNGLFVLKPNLSVSVEDQPTNVITCETGDEVQFSVSSSEQGVTFQWQENSSGYFKNIRDNDLFSGTETSLLSVANYNDSIYGTNFRCLLTALDNRFSYSDEVRIVNNNDAQVSFTFTEDNGLYEFINTSSRQGDLLWVVEGDDEIANEDTVNFIFSNSGDFRVSLSIENDCGRDSKEEIITVLTGLNTSDLNGDITVYPSPSTGLVTVKIENLPLGEISFEFFDVSGRLRKAEKVDNFSVLLESQVNLLGLEKGVYVFKISGGGEVLKKGKIVLL